MPQDETPVGPAKPVITIGYGNRSWDQFRELLTRHRVDVLIDVRSRPFSQNRDFTMDSLRSFAGTSFEYVFMGERLGGKPDGAPLTREGKIDYRAMEENRLFQNALRNMFTIAQDGKTLALMCSELRPEECHRSKLIGEALVRRGVAVAHIDADGSLIPHGTVVARLSGGQMTLRGGAANLDTSRGRIQ